MNRSGKVFYGDAFAGIISEDENGYAFKYDIAYLASNNPRPISLTLPLETGSFQNKVLFPFFDGLIPEGWLMAIAIQNWNISPRDRMGLLLTVCRDCIGAVSVISENIEIL